MRKVLVVHYGPIDKYPPAFNFLRYFHAQVSSDVKIGVLSSKRSLSTRIKGLDNVDNLSINDSKYQSLFFINILFNLRLLWLTLFKGYNTILYYETFSALVPSILNLSPIRSNYRIAVHFHEFVSKLEIANASYIYKLVDFFERKALKYCYWISHTNQDRMNLFLKENPAIDVHKTHLLPNYPPKVWKKIRSNKKLDKSSSKKKLVYVGALNNETMFVSELISFINTASGRFELNIYSDNFTDKTAALLKTAQSDNILFHGGVSYDQLPEILPHYDIGLVLYRGHIPNYIYNAPNKVFEYLACGVPVLFPQKMKSVYGYSKFIQEKYLFPANFEDLKFEDVYNWINELNIESLWKGYDLYCEHVYEELLTNLIH